MHNRVVNHDRKSCWKDQRFLYIGCAVLYADLCESKKIEMELRSYFNPPVVDDKDEGKLTHIQSD